MDTTAANTARSEEIMDGFARRTGLADEAGTPPRRYLWTDAFAVCNYLGLFRRTGKEAHLELALRLIDQVHRVLGRHRDDDPRQGWISGLDEEEGARHPTRGGLRIGKGHGERSPDEPFNEQAEWDRDGQYFHYLTKWMHALARTTDATGDPRYHRWAVELARAAHAAFLHLPAGGEGHPRMYWKMSIDLSRPLVPSMGQHDPLDALVTLHQLRSTAPEGEEEKNEDLLGREIREIAPLCLGIPSWATGDPLGIGGLLFDACRLFQLPSLELPSGQELLPALLDDAAASLEHWALQHPWEAPPHARLAFRELGLSIGLHAVDRMQDILARHPQRFPDHTALNDPLGDLAAFRPVAEAIEMFWLQPGNREFPGWAGHLDINSAMLATSLDPDGFLILGS